jgi:hypothetical protein
MIYTEKNLGIYLVFYFDSIKIVMFIDETKHTEASLNKLEKEKKLFCADVQSF